VSNIDVVDLNRAVYDLNHWFASDNGAVLKDPRLHLFVDDGRQFLKLTSGLYDFATMEPPPPFMPGIARLYSADYYSALKRHLRPGALVSQWLPEYQLDQRGVDLVIATFIDAFPEAFLFVGFGRELVLVGSDRPINFARLQKALGERPLVRAELARLGYTKPCELLATILRTTSSLDREWKGRPLIRDGFLSLEASMSGMGQAVHTRSPFWASKSNLSLDRDDVSCTLKRTVPAEIDAVKALWDSPQIDPAYSQIVPALYLRKS
jgi:hypothetical protein